MDYNKIGLFITNERKTKGLTQTKLAEKIFVSEKTISKWENGKGVPDAESIIKLSEIFQVSINELLNGERFNIENYVDKAESKMLELQKQKEINDKRLLLAEILFSVFSLILFIMINLVIFLTEMQTWLKILIGISAFVIILMEAGFAIRIEQVAGYYMCGKCNHKYIPTYGQVFLAPHINRTRYMRCPNCRKTSWNRKVIK